MSASRAIGLTLAFLGAAACALPAYRPTPYAEPSAAAVFVAAHADPHGPPPGLSPLHRAELARRRVPSVERNPLWAEAATRLVFGYLGGLVDRDGFGHALYVARPKRTDVDGPTTLWRIDLDPAGRVIWGEPVRLLEGTAVRRVVDADAATAELADLPRPRRWSGLTPGRVVGVRAEDGAGYYAVGLHRRPGGRPDAVLFVIAETGGALSRDPWSYGQPVPVADGTGGRLVAGPFQPEEPGLTEDERALLRAYLLTLG
jgi:hypothetical protein